MNSHERGVLIGMTWGDGCIKVKRHTLKNGKDTKYYEFVAGHSSKQKEYIEYKRDVFHSIIGGKKPEIHSRSFKLGQKEHTELRFSRQHKYFKLLHHWVYPYGKKTYSRRALDYLNPRGIAFWYMDDGGLAKNKNKQGEISSYEMRFFTYCSEEEIDTIIKYFYEVWGVQGKKRFYKKNKSWNLVFNTKSSKKLELLIKPYMIESMYYKLPSNWVTRERDTLMGDDIV